MKRICFIGDSHLACINKAWDAAQGAAAFFAAPGKGMAQLEVRDGALSSDHPDVARYLALVSGGLERIDASYDAYVLHALHLEIAIALGLLREMRGQAPPARLVGTADYRVALRDAIGNSLAVTTLRKLRQITKAPIAVSPAPMADKNFAALRARLAELDAAAPLAALFAEECALACRSLKAAFVPQPPETLGADGLATKAEYVKDAARFSQAIRKEDIVHMNAQYGASVVAAVMQALL